MIINTLMIDTLTVTRSSISAEPHLTRVEVTYKGHSFFAMALDTETVSAWEKNEELGGRVMELLMGSHPAAVIVNDLWPLLPHISSLTKQPELDLFVARTRMIVAGAQDMS